MTYSNRFWVQGANGKWSSRPPDRDDYVRREAMLARFSGLISSEKYRELIESLKDPRL